MISKFSILLATGAALMLSACGEEAPAPDANANAGSSGQVAAVDTSTVSYFQQSVGDRVFFDTDSAAISPLAQQTLVRQAAWLAQNPGINVVVEGHADERGTREYNLALGARRADSARAFLISQGVAASRLRTISYGKERPEAACSAANCWAQNRRSVSVLAGAPTS
ncbi:MAG: peptidoglycan-associated lipoprotein Pal [Pikeienuella sp.]